MRAGWVINTLCRYRSAHQHRKHETCWRVFLQTLASNTSDYCFANLLFYSLICSIFHAINRCIKCIKAQQIHFKFYWCTFIILLSPISFTDHRQGAFYHIIVTNIFHWPPSGCFFIILLSPISFTDHRQGAFLNNNVILIKVCLNHSTVLNTT